MASYLDKAQINTAITDNTKLDLGCQRISTADFMQTNVAYLHEMVPGEKIDINMETFARLNPLPVPTFGRASMRHRAYFVPFRTIFRGWNDFITDAIHIASDGYQGPTTNILSQCPTIEMYELADVFKTSIGSTSTGGAMLYPSPDVAVYDVSWSGGQGYYNFTTAGRQCIKLLEDLGYKVDFDATSGDAKSSITLSAMPLLALAKVYCDWMFPQQYSNISLYDNLLSMCNLDVAAGPLKMTARQARTILTACSYVQFDSDYFVSAWDQPNSPNVSNYSNFKLVNIDTVGQVYGSGSSVYNITQQNGVSNNSSTATNSGDAIDRYGRMDAPFITGYLGAGSNTLISGGGISEYLLHSLHALTDYMKRHQLAGSSNFARYLARFGKALPAEKLNRSVYLGAEVQNIQIGDIMSTADTEGANLGSFAGKGMSYGQGQFSYNTDEYGYIIIISSIVPASGYFQGIDRQVLRTTKLQYWTPKLIWAVAA